jgi:glutathione-independent formaldehyde dehydrogenase
MIAMFMATTVPPPTVRRIEPVSSIPRWVDRPAGPMPSLPFATSLFPSGYDSEEDVRTMAGNRAVVYQGPGKVTVETVDYPELVLKPGPGVPPGNENRKCPHGMILKVVSTNICGSDQHMVRGRTTAPVGLILGHEITGEVVELGPDVENFRIGDLVSVPFNVSCGRCRNCRERKTGVCLNVNPERPGGAYGYVDMGGWPGGQAEYVMVPYADWTGLRFPDRDQAMEKIRDLTMLTDIFPTGYHGCVTAGVTTGSTVYVAGAGPVGLAAATSAFLLGAAAVIVGDLNADRLAHARTFGCLTVDPSAGPLPDQIDQLLGVPEVDAAVDCVGFEAKASKDGHEAPAVVLNAAMEVTRAGGAIGIPGLYVTDDPGATDPDARVGALSLRFGLGWAKSHVFSTGQCPVLRYNRDLMMAILDDRVQIARNVNATVITLDEAPDGYAQFDAGVPQKFVIDPHGMLKHP